MALYVPADKWQAAQNYQRYFEATEESHLQSSYKNRADSFQLRNVKFQSALNSWAYPGEIFFRGLNDDLGQLL